MAELSFRGKYLQTPVPGHGCPRVEGFPSLDPRTQPFGGKGDSGGASPQHAWTHVLPPCPGWMGTILKAIVPSELLPRIALGTPWLWLHRNPGGQVPKV